tara:strand:+ start:1604 stop:2422 length:819 start_codon:yes stop_codon:yes gene_type:complete
MSLKKGSHSRSRDKQEAREQITEELSPEDFYENPDPIKTALKLNEFKWTDKQKEFFKIALNQNTRIMFVDGPAGSSKTLLSVYCGLQLMNMKACSDIMYLRSAVESSDSKLGYLPGSAEEKLKYFNMPFIDKLDELLKTTRPEKLIEQKRVGMFPVNFARGMNWTNKVIILDEAQNCTEKEIITILTRMGKGSRCFVLADPMQTDLHNNKIGAFEKLNKIFSDDDSYYMGIRTFEFTEEDIMRSMLTKFLIKKLKEEKEKKINEDIRRWGSE